MTPSPNFTNPNPTLELEVSSHSPVPHSWEPQRPLYLNGFMSFQHLTVFLETVPNDRDNTFKCTSNLIGTFFLTCPEGCRSLEWILPLLWCWHYHSLFPSSLCRILHLDCTVLSVHLLVLPTLKRVTHKPTTIYSSAIMICIFK